MDILNEIDPDKYMAVNEFLAFLGVYEDEERISAYKKGLARTGIKGGVVVEAGAGLGKLSEIILEIVEPRVLYLVETNEYCVDFLHKKFSGVPEVRIIEGFVEEFEPEEKYADLLVHDFFGPLLYDESLGALDNLSFQPQRVFPDGGYLWAQAVPWKDMREEVMELEMFKKVFDGILVQDLFPLWDQFQPQLKVAEWQFSKGLKMLDTDVEGFNGEVLVFGLEIRDRGEKLLIANAKSNWGFVFTPITGRKFQLKYRYRLGYTEVTFSWVK